jgi:hypothetical protein
MENFKLFSYGFIHFEDTQSKEEFYNDFLGRRILLEKEKNVVVHFFPVKRKLDERRNKHVI